MLLLYPFKRYKRFFNVFIYIPLCFYFILHHPGNFPSCIPFTFHYASTLSERAGKPGLNVILFTFHYASTLSQQAAARFNIPAPIYIPLCFYFIDCSSGSKSSLSSIYIPLCFYFIFRRDMGLYSDLEFTFHYASTLSRRALSCRARVSPIYIPLCFYFILSNYIIAERGKKIYIPLCFYFIPAAFLILSGTCCIYIPLCFYFIMILCLHPESTVPFTFHYASTLSDMATAKKLPSGSIYIPLCFYFITAWMMKPEKHLRIYIPLCFYFITQGDIEKLTITNLHSTMLLLYQSRYNGHLEASSFTFHYASTLSAANGDGWTIIPIYIPLCFYFICLRFQP